MVAASGGVDFLRGWYTVVWSLVEYFCLHIRAESRIFAVSKK